MRVKNKEKVTKNLGHTEGLLQLIAHIEVAHCRHQ
jgi:hypothetical protein